MSKLFLFDFSRVLLFAKDPSYQGDLNPLHDRLTSSPDRGFSFFNHFELNQDLLNYLEANKGKGIDFAIFTSGDVQKDQELVSSRKLDVFSRILCLEDLNGALPNPSKTDPETYLEVCKALGYQPQDVLFVDDSAKNIAAATAAGLKTKHYLSNEDLFPELVAEQEQQKLA